MEQYLTKKENGVDISPLDENETWKQWDRK